MESKNNKSIREKIMVIAKNKQKIIVSAIIKRKNGTIEDKGTLTEIKSPFLLQKFKNIFKRKCK